MVEQVSEHPAPQVPTSAAGAANWWGEKPAWAVAVLSPTAAARQVLVEACGQRGGLDEHGQPLDDAMLLRRARICTHPDHRGGDRTAWDRVETAARALGLVPVA